MIQRSIKKCFIFNGVLLFFFGLVTGIIVQATSIPRVAMAAHVEALMGGMVLILMGGIVWEHVRLSARVDRFTRIALVCAFYANWFFLLIAAIWGAGKSLPLAAKGAVASDWQELIVAIGLITVSLVLLSAITTVIVGLLKNKDD